MPFSSVERAGLDPEQRKECSECNAEKRRHTIAFNTKSGPRGEEICLSCHVGCLPPRQGPGAFLTVPTVFKGTREGCSEERRGLAVQYVGCTGAFGAAQADVRDVGEEDDYGISAIV